MKKNMIEDLRAKTKEIIFGFGKEYTSLVQQYRDLKNDDNYTAKYKEKKKAELLEKLKTGRVEAYKKAIALVDQERKDNKRKKSNYNNLSLEEKTLIALEKNNLIQMAMLKVKGAPVETLKEFVQANDYDEDVKTIVQAELKERANKDGGLDNIEKALSMELRMAKDVFGIVEQQLRTEMADEDKVSISYGNVRSIKKNFDIEEVQHYFKDDTESGNISNGSTLPTLGSGGTGEVKETNYFGN